MVLGCFRLDFLKGASLNIWLTRICDRCMAQTGKYCTDALNYRNFGKDAAWPMTQINHETYLSLDARNLSPWSVVDGWRIETVGFDILHNLFLGTARDLIASSIRTFISYGVYPEFEGHDLDTILDFIHREMHQACAEHGFLPCNPIFWILGFTPKQ